jgi:hypothetical protein
MAYDIAAWISAYRVAWETNEPGDILALFTETAEYRPDPYGEVWTGHDGIVASWLSRREEPGDTEFSWSPLVEGPDIAVAQCVTAYRTGEVYDNLFVVRFAGDGRATEFTDWWVQRTE